MESSAEADHSPPHRLSTRHELARHTIRSLSSHTHLEISINHICSFRKLSSHQLIPQPLRQQAQNALKIHQSQKIQLLVLAKDGKAYNTRSLINLNANDLLV